MKSHHIVGPSAPRRADHQHHRLTLGEFRKFDGRAINSLRGKIWHRQTSLQLSKTFPEFWLGIFFLLLDRGQTVGLFLGGSHELPFTRRDSRGLNLDAGLGQRGFGASIFFTAVADDRCRDDAIAADDKLRGNARDAVKLAGGALLKRGGAALMTIKNEF